MVTIFKTNIQKKQDAESVLNVLMQLFPNATINFDLEDCDNILRVEGTAIQAVAIINNLENLNYKCVELH